MLSSLEVVTPLAAAPDDSKQLLVTYGLVIFCCRNAPRLKSYKIPVAFSKESLDVLIAVRAIAEIILSLQYSTQ
jgi:hypothetical protein